MYKNKFKDGFLDDLWLNYSDMIKSSSNSIYLNCGHDILLGDNKGVINSCSEILKYCYRNIRYSSKFDFTFAMICLFLDL